MDRFEHDIWLYRGQEARIFCAGEAIPPASEGWSDTPVPETPKDPFDHDGDGKPGGSRRRKKD